MMRRFGFGAGLHTHGLCGSEPHVVALREQTLHLYVLNVAPVDAVSSEILTQLTALRIGP